jgi:hypothetical protein
MALSTAPASNHREKTLPKQAKNQQKCKFLFQINQINRKQCAKIAIVANSQHVLRIEIFHDTRLTTPTFHS